MWEGMIVYSYTEFDKSYSRDLGRYDSMVISLRQ